jgi:flagellar hook-associated protein 3 FlgL
MRVTGKMIRDKVLYNMNATMERLQRCQTQLATGKRLLKPSDDPVCAAKSIKARALLADNEQFLRNIDDGIGWLENTEPVIDEILSIVMDLKDIAIKGANDTNSQSERAVLAEETERLLEELVRLADTSYGHRYVFAGTYTRTKPYEASYSVEGESVALPDLNWIGLANARLSQGSVVVSGPLGEVYTEGVDYEIDYELGMLRRLGGGAMDAATTYSVSYRSNTISSIDLLVPDTAGDLNREVAEGVYQKMNAGGEDILRSRVDIPDLLVAVKTALYRNDGVSVSMALDDIETALEQVASVIARAGVRRNGLDLARSRLESEIVNVKSVISQFEDADMAEVMVRFETQQMAYEAALSAGANIMTTSLINFIR